MQPTICCVVGTRPEAVKMAPVILRLRGEDSPFQAHVVATAQHRGLLDRALADFAIRTDIDLDLMQAGQDLAGLTARALSGLSAAFRERRPDLVLAQGDTTTVLCAALAAFYEGIPFGHIEAGLRTGRDDSPFPEEKNRVLVAQLARLHFAPTLAARNNLLREGIAPERIHVTGNTGIDALRLIAGRELPLPIRTATPRYLLVTAHRRENWGEPLGEICAGLRDILDRHRDLSAVFPVHPNPRVRIEVMRWLGGQERVHLLHPLDYPTFVGFMKAATLVVTDSGGVQEEAPALGKPVVVVRDATERQEAVTCGAATIAAPRRRVVAEAIEAALRAPGRVVSPFGDGLAAERIVRVLRERFGLDSGPPVSPFLEAG